MDNIDSLRAHALGIKLDAGFDAVREFCQRRADPLRAAGEDPRVPYSLYAAAARRAEQAERRLGDYTKAAEYWCNEANRNRRAFIRASIIAYLMALALLSGAIWRLA